MKLCFRLFWLLNLVLTMAILQAQPPEYLLPPVNGPVKYNKESIYLRYSTYTKNNEIYRIGVTGAGLKHEFDSSPEAMKLFNSYQKQRRWSLVCSLAQVAVAAVAFSSHNKSRRTTFQISGAAISLVAVPLYIGSYNNLNKAVWLRNGALMSFN